MTQMTVCQEKSEAKSNAWTGFEIHSEDVSITDDYHFRVQSNNVQVFTFFHVR
jgi:hypothetical protein